MQTLLSITHFFSEAFFCEEYARQKGFLQSIDPRVKLMGIISLIVTLSFIHKVPLFIGGLVLAFILALSSRIKLRFFILRTWLFIPLFTVLMVLPALFNIFVPGEPLIVLMHFQEPITLGPFHLPELIFITRQGTLSATLLVLRTGISLSFIILLIWTTKWFHLLKALSFFKCPRSLVLTLSITYRYIHLLLKTMQEMHMVFLSRTLKKPSFQLNLRFIISGLHLMVRKSLQTQEDVYAAMRSKGFTGDIKILDRFQFRLPDAFFLFLTGTWIIGSLYLNHL